jgi:hypothetical protein
MQRLDGADVVQHAPVHNAAAAAETYTTTPTTQHIKLMADSSLTVTRCFTNARRFSQHL